MWVHLPPPPRCLTSGLDSLASVSTRAVALTAWASSCSTSLWVLAASRILGRTREGKSSTWEGLQLLFFRRAERAQSQRLFQQVVESPTPFLRLCHLRVQLEEDLMLKIKNVYSSSKRLDVKSQNSFFRTFYRLSNRQNQTSFNDHDKPPLWPFHKVHKCN